MSPSKVAFVAPNYYPLTCGVGDHSMRLAAELARRGQQPTVFTHAPAAPHPEAPHIPVVGVAESAPIRIAASLSEQILAGGFSRVIIQYTPQMWGASRWGSPALPLLAGALHGEGLDVTLLIHEPFTPWRPRPDLAVGAALMRLQLAAVLRSAQRTFVTTESRRGLISPMVDALPSRRPVGVLRVGPNALPIPAHRPAGRRRMGLFSTLAFGKSYDTVLDAFDEVHRTYPDAELVLLGDLGSPSSRAGSALAARISRSPAVSRIRLTGKLPLAEVARTLSELDVYLFPMNTGANTRSSTLPIALGAGLPVVAINGPETDRLFADGENVRFAAGLDGPSFARAALDIFADRTLADGLSAGARRLYEQHLSWERIGDSFLAALN